MIVSPLCDITDPTQLSAIAAEYGGVGASDRARGRGARDLGTAPVTSAAVATTAAKVLGLAQMIERGRCAWMCEPCCVLGDGGGGHGWSRTGGPNRPLTMAAQLRALGAGTAWR